MAAERRRREVPAGTAITACLAGAAWPGNFDQAAIDAEADRGRLGRLPTNLALARRAPRRSSASKGQARRRVAATASSKAPRSLPVLKTQRPSIAALITGDLPGPADLLLYDEVAMRPGALTARR